MKFCKTCSRDKPRSEFYRAPTKDGLQYQCKQCAKSYQRRWHQDNPDYRKSYASANRLSSKGKYGGGNSKYNLALRHLRMYRGLSERDLEVSFGYREAIEIDPCFYCGSDNTDATDHYVPIAFNHHPDGLTGTDIWYNLVRCCKSCNSTKKNRCGTWMLLRRT